MFHYALAYNSLGRWRLVSRSLLPTRLISEVSQAPVQPKMLAHDLGQDRSRAHGSTRQSLNNVLTFFVVPIAWAAWDCQERGGLAGAGPAGDDTRST